MRGKGPWVSPFHQNGALGSTELQVGSCGKKPPREAVWEQADGVGRVTFPVTWDTNQKRIKTECMAEWPGEWHGCGSDNRILCFGQQPCIA